jgi:hypothetical protein
MGDATSATVHPVWQKYPVGGCNSVTERDILGFWISWAVTRMITGFLHRAASEERAAVAMSNINILTANAVDDSCSNADPAVAPACSTGFRSDHPEKYSFSASLLMTKGKPRWRPSGTRCD